MVNNNNQNNWVPPKEWTPNIPQAITVNYYYPEEVAAITPLVKNGVYQSQKALINEPSYGPVITFFGDSPVKEC